jgi:hypothetical protein
MSTFNTDDNIITENDFWSFLLSQSQLVVAATPGKLDSQDYNAVRSS